jgi:hypothetical protein
MTGAPFGRRLAADAASAGVQLGSPAAAQISAGALIVVSRGVRSGRWTALSLMETRFSQILLSGRAYFIYGNSAAP